MGHSGAWMPLLTGVLLVSNRAEASDQEEVGTTPTLPDHAEYARLHQELESLAERNAWAGAARTYDKLVATGVPPAYDDLLYGAHAAQAIGNVGAVRERLLAAKELQEEKEVIESLWALDAAYAAVDLRCDPGVGWELTSTARPFEPDQVRAIEFAIGRVAADCAFAGYLPAGSYEFCGHPFDVHPGVHTVGMDLRGLPVPKKQGKKAKKAKDDE